VMRLKGLLWLLCVPGVFTFGAWESRVIFYAAAATGIFFWTAMALPVIAGVIHSNSRTSKPGASSW